MTSADTTRPGAQRWTTTLDGRQLRRLRRQHGLSQEQLAADPSQPDHRAHLERRPPRPASRAPFAASPPPRSHPACLRQPPSPDSPGAPRHPQ